MATENIILVFVLIRLNNIDIHLLRIKRAKTASTKQKYEKQYNSLPI